LRDRRIAVINARAIIISRFCECIVWVSRRNQKRRKSEKTSGDGGSILEKIYYFTLEMIVYNYLYILYVQQLFPKY